MTEIDFHFNAADKVIHTCRLLRKAVVASGARVVVRAAPALLDEVDAALWRFSPQDFIAHCRHDSAPEMLQRSPVVLVPDDSASPPNLPHRQVLVNLAADLPEGFERFERLIEIVTEDDADRHAARARWRHYADRGYAMQRHDLAQRGG